MTTSMNCEYSLKDIEVIVSLFVVRLIKIETSSFPVVADMELLSLTPLLHSWEVSFTDEMTYLLL